MVELIELEKKHYGFCAWLYESNYGGYSFRKLCGYSKTAAIKELRKNGVKCPKRAYTNT